MRRRVLGLVAVALGLVVLVGCAGNGALAEHRFRGRTLAGSMRAAPEPRVFADYSVRLDRRDPVGSVLGVATSIAKAGSVQKAQARLERALEAVDVPEEIRASAAEECAKVLGCDTVERAGGADYVLSMEIREYGIDATSSGGSTEFRVDLGVVLFGGEDERTIWKARVREETAITPEVFGLGGSVGNVLSAAALAELSEEEIGRGLMKLARSVAYRVADRLERDLTRARRR
jgi:hypothetical protein